MSPNTKTAAIARGWIAKQVGPSNWDVTEDIFQTACHNATRKIAALRTDNFAGFFLRIVRNATTDHFRNLKKLHPTISFNTLEEIDDPGSDHDPFEGTPLYHEELATRIEVATQCMPDKWRPYWTVIRNMEDYTCEAVADAVGVCESTARYHLKGLFEWLKSPSHGLKEFA